MKECDFIEQDDGTFKCSRCEKVKPYRTRRNCPAPAGMGDLAERVFKLLGFKATPNCPCAKRKWVLNHWTANARSWLHSFRTFMLKIIGLG